MAGPSVDKFTLCFSDPSLELAFRADTFRVGYSIQMGILLSVCITLTVGLSDAGFSSISACLLPIIVIETLGRQYLHVMKDFSRAQQFGAASYLFLSSASWIAYVCATYVLRGMEPAGSLITALIACCMTLYPLMLGLFMMSPAQRAVSTAVAVASIGVAPAWSQLSKPEGEQQPDTPARDTGRVPGRDWTGPEPGRGRVAGGRGAQGWQTERAPARLQSSACTCPRWWRAR